MFLCAPRSDSPGLASRTPLPCRELADPGLGVLSSDAVSILHVSVFSRGLKKSSQELYGLICYGELRKKVGGCEYGAPGGSRTCCTCSPPGLLSCPVGSLWPGFISLQPDSR